MNITNGNSHLFTVDMQSVMDALNRAADHNATQRVRALIEARKQALSNECDALKNEAAIVSAREDAIWSRLADIQTEQRSIEYALAVFESLSPSNESTSPQ